MDGAHRTLGRIKKLEKHTYFTEDGTGTINPDTVTSGRYFLTAIAEDAGDLPVDLPVWLDVSLVLSEDGTHARVRQTIQSDGDPTKIFVRTAPLGSEGTSSPEWGDGDSWTESDSSSTSITLSDAVDSDSSGTAASSLAVKIAYDAATAAQQTADEALNNHGGGCVTCSIPVIEGVDAVSIGSVASYTVSSVCGLQGAEITEFTWRLDEGDAQTAVAEDGQAILSLTLPPETEADSIHALTVIAHDSFGGASLPATRTFTAKKWNIAQPEVTSPVSGSVVAPDSMVITTSAFAVVGTDDTHVKSRYRISADRQGDSLLYDSGETADLLSHTATLSDPLSTGEAVYISVQHIGATLGASAWSEPVPVVPSWIATPSVTAPVADARITRFNLTIGTSAFACLSDKEDTHAATAYRVTSADGQTSYYEQESASDLTRLVIADVDIPDQTPIAVSARHKGAVLGWSAWSEPVMATIVPRIPMSEEKQFLSAGSHSFTVPDGVTQLRVLVVGAGARGSAATSKTGGTGGKGGGIGAATINVTPGQVIPLTVGATGGTAGSSGGDSIFGTWLTAKGGTLTAHGSVTTNITAEQGEVIYTRSNAPGDSYLSCKSYKEMSLNQWGYDLSFSAGSSPSGGTAGTDGSAGTYGIGGNGGDGRKGSDGTAGSAVDNGGRGENGGTGGRGGYGGGRGGYGGAGGSGGRGGKGKSPASGGKGGTGGNGGTGSKGGAGGSGGTGGTGGAITQTITGATKGASGGSGGTGGTGGAGSAYGGSGGTGGSGGKGGTGGSDGGLGAYGGTGGTGGTGGNGGNGGIGGNGGNGGTGGDGGSGGSAKTSTGVGSKGSTGTGGTGGNGGSGCVVVFY